MHTRTLHVHMRKARPERPHGSDSDFMKALSLSICCLYAVSIGLNAATTPSRAEQSRA